MNIFLKEMFLGEANTSNQGKYPPKETAWKEPIHHCVRNILDRFTPLLGQKICAEKKSTIEITILHNFNRVKDVFFLDLFRIRFFNLDKLIKFN